MTDIDRRAFLVGTAAVATAAGLPGIATKADPLVYGFTYQSWPFDEPRSEYWCSGSVGDFNNALRPLSTYAARIKQMGDYEPIWWKPIFPGDPNDRT